MIATIALAWASTATAASVSAERLARGQELYVRNCLACHQLNGEGIAGVFPPLAKSDYLAADVDRSIRAVVSGLAGQVVVNGKPYNGLMPPVVIDDGAVADVMTFVLNSWGNAGGEVSADQVKRVRGRTKFPTFEALKSSSEYPPLPPAPEGFTLREVVRLPQKVARMASDGKGERMFLLSENGDVWDLEIATGNLKQILFATSYLERRKGDLGAPLFVVGLARDAEGRLYILSNQQNEATLPVQNIVTIYRTTRFEDRMPAEPKVWFQASYPGNAAYVHAAEHLAFGPDGFLYMNNGSRTDGGEPSRDSKRWLSGGETPVTAAIWRIDPKQEKPGFEVYARGLRNAYGFCWNERGEMFATENGPTANAPEELNLIEQGKHYGFPYTYADFGAKKVYPHTPDAPPGLEFTLPIPNLGPHAGFDGKPIYTFDPHSSPAGIVYLGDDFPAGYRGTFIIARFGSMERVSNAGFDVVRATLSRGADGKYQAQMHTLLAPLGRPIDVHLAGKGKIYICEYSRGTTVAMGWSQPGRILELAVK